MFGAKVFRKFGEAIDRRYLKKVAATPVPGSNLNLLLVCFHPYEGKNPIQTGDKVMIHPHDPVGELHLSNIRVTEIAGEPGENSMEWRLIGILKGEFGLLADACVKQVIPENIRAFYGVNVLPPAARRMGFTLVPIPKGWNRWWLGFWESVLRLIYYSYKTKKKFSLQRTKDPYEIWLSREELIRRYGVGRG
jgi:hypothetical protein